MRWLIFVLLAAGCATPRSWGGTERSTPRSPTVRVSNGERRMAVLSADEQAATRQAIEAASPGWAVSVSALGFITSATRVTGGEDFEKTLAALREFSARHAVALGFAEAPPVEKRGDSFIGARWSVGPLTAKTGVGDVTLEGHAWPFRCPHVDVAKALAPWLGKPMVREQPGQPCDAQGDVSCEGLAPSSQQAPLTLRDVLVQPEVVLELDGDDARLRCVAKLTLRGSLVGKSRLPDAIDADTGEAMVGALLTEAQLR